MADLRALITEERAAAEGSSAEAYAALLKRRLASRPIVLDIELLERTIVRKPWADGRCTVHRWEDVRLDWPGFITERLAEHGRTVDRASIAERLAAMPAQAHSVPGQGATLSDEDRALVRSLYLQHPHLDFRPIDAGAPRV